MDKWMAGRIWETAHDADIYTMLQEKNRKKTHWVSFTCDFRLSLQMLYLLERWASLLSKLRETSIEILCFVSMVIVCPFAGNVQSTPRKKQL